MSASERSSSAARHANLVTSIETAGIELVCTLASSAVTAIRAAVNEIVDAFDAFVTYAIDFVCDAFSALIAQPLQAINDSIQGWAMRLISLIDSASEQITAYCPPTSTNGSASSIGIAASEGWAEILRAPCPHWLNCRSRNSFSTTAASSRRLANGLPIVPHARGYRRPHIATGWGD